MTGKDIYILLNDTPIAATRSDEIQTQCEAVEVSGPTTGQWRQFIAGQKQWGFTTNALVFTATNLADLLMAGEEYAITIVSGNTALTGTALCTEAKLTATVGNLCQGGWSFIGSGELVAGAAPSSYTI